MTAVRHIARDQRVRWACVGVAVSIIASSWVTALRDARDYHAQAVAAQARARDFRDQLISAQADADHWWTVADGRRVALITARRQVAELAKEERGR